MLVMTDIHKKYDDQNYAIWLKRYELCLGRDDDADGWTNMVAMHWSAWGDLGSERDWATRFFLSVSHPAHDDDDGDRDDEDGRGGGHGHDDGEDWEESDHVDHNQKTPFRSMIH